MSSEFDDIIKELRGYRNDLDAAISFLSNEDPRLSDDRRSLNQRFAGQDKIFKDVFFHLERLFRIAGSHRLQIIELYESIMSLPEVQTNPQLQQKIRDRFEAVKDKQS